MNRLGSCSACWNLDDASLAGSGSLGFDGLAAYSMISSLEPWIWTLEEAGCYHGIMMLKPRLDLIVLRVLWLTLWVGLLGSCVPAWAGPEIQIEEPEFDFGEIWQDEKVDHVFVFRNVGDETLKILDIKSGCGCTAAVISDEDMELEPGEEGSLAVTFDSKGRYGKTSMSVQLSSNDPAQRMARVLLKGNIQEFIIPSVRIVNLGRVPRGWLATPQTVTLQSGDGQPFDVIEVYDVSEELEVSFDSRVDGTHELTVKLAQAPGLQERDVLRDGTFWIRTNHPNLERFPMRVRWNVIKEIICPQGRITMITEQGKPVDGVFDVVRVTEGRFQVQGLEPLFEFVSHEIRELKPAELASHQASYGVQIRLEVDSSAPVGNHMHDILVKTDDPQNTDVKVVFALRVHPSRRRTGTGRDG